MSLMLPSPLWRTEGLPHLLGKVLRNQSESVLSFVCGFARCYALDVTISTYLYRFHLLHKTSTGAAGRNTQYASLRGPCPTPATQAPQD